MGSVVERDAVRVARASTASRQRRAALARLAVHAVLLIFAALWLFPFLWMLLSSLKTADETFHKQTFLPQFWDFANYPDALRTIPYLRYTLNTVILSAANVIGILISSTPPA